MNLLIRNAKIIDPNSPHHLKVKDIFIKNGSISAIGSKLKGNAAVRELTGNNIHVSPGWLDLNASLGDPGFEYKEDITSGMKAAAAGGFTGVCCTPDTFPVIHSKSEIEYVKQKSAGGLVDVWPVGALTKNLEGKEITEMYDMRQSGAVAFSDAYKSISDAGVMMRALLYAKSFDGVIFSYPEDYSVSNHSVMNESEMSVMLGMHGNPSLSEELIIIRDLYLLDYTESRLHFSMISTRRAVSLIKESKSKGTKLSAAVSPFHLFATDELLKDFDSNYKINPPLRTKEDVKALIKGISEGTIDVICSAHVPQDIESKNVEFEMALHGIISLETAFAIANTALKKSVSIEQIINCFAIAPRKILSLNPVVIDEDDEANLTIFDPEKSWIYEEKNIRSKSKNSPFIGQTFTGKILGVVNNNKMQLN